MHLSVNTHNLLMAFVPRSFADGIDDAVETFATHLKDSRVRKLKMKECEVLSPNHIATLCRGLHWSRSLEELCIVYSSPEKVRPTCNCYTLCSLNSCTNSLSACTNLYEG